jgi:hypothetical protein
MLGLTTSKNIHPTAYGYVAVSQQRQLTADDLTELQRWSTTTAAEVPQTVAMQLLRAITAASRHAPQR